MKRTLPDESVREMQSRLMKANSEFARLYPGESPRRQPVHILYGGAHLFKFDAIKKLGRLALRSLEEYAPTPRSFSDASDSTTENSLRLSTAV